jgi:hypothetical protein
MPARCTSDGVVTQKWINRALAVFAWGLLASMLAAALHDVSMAWDVWYYHLPFAARIVGIVPASQFAYDPLNQARFDGFPLLAETLQGALWRITGRPESANLVAFATIPLFAWFVKKTFAVPMYLTIIGLLAVPLVQIHATSCYVDLPSNAAASVVVLIAIKAWGDADDRPDLRLLLVAGVAAGVAANMKALMHPIVLVALVALGARVVPRLLRERRFGVVAMMLIALPLVFATPLKNLALHGNPYYPVEFHLAGHTLPGPEEPYASSPVWLEHAPRPLRFVCSILELRLPPLGIGRWTLDQWTPPDAPAYRMGGFFGAYVVLHLVVLVWRGVRERRDRVVRVACLGFLAMTAIVSVLPQSHELRYYLGWMIVLVALNLHLASLRSARPDGTLMGLACAGALGVVLMVTRCEYAYPSGRSFDALVRVEVDDAILGKVHDGEEVCVRRAPWNFLWASRFHAPRNYAVREAVTPAECDGAPAL